MKLARILLIIATWSVTFAGWALDPPRFMDPVHSNKPPDYDSTFFFDHLTSAPDNSEPNSALVRMGQRETTVAYHEYLRWRYKHTMSIYNLQYWVAVGSFLLTTLVVCTGLYFSYLQFKRGQDNDPESSIEASLAGIKMSSSVLGLLILVISLVFYYLYLAHVFPIVSTTG